jgi:hypothetical protein
VLLAAVSSGQLSTVVQVVDAAELLGRVRDTHDQIEALGNGRYRDATVTVLEQFDMSGYTGLIDRAISEGTVPLAEIIASLSSRDDEGFNGYRTAVNDQLTARIEELGANQDDELSSRRAASMKRVV